MAMKRIRDTAELSDTPPEMPQMCQESAPGSPPPWKRPKVCINYQFHASFKAHSLQLDSLHLIMPIWLARFVSSSHKSRPLVWVD